jgi:outer membrane protein
MRFEQQKWPRMSAYAAIATAVCLFGSGRPLFASGQEGKPQAPPAQQQTMQTAPGGVPGSTLKLTADEAVRMSLENNLGVQASRLGPQISTFGVAQARAAYTPSVFVNTLNRNATNAPSDFTAGNVSTITTTTFNSAGGLQQALKWGGGRYSLSMSGSRGTTTSFTNPFNPSLTSNLNASYTQPLLANFKIDNIRNNILQSVKQEEVADLQLRQQITQTSRIVRNAYYDLVGAISNLNIAKESRDLALTQLKNNRTKVEVGTLPPIDILESEAEVSRTEEGVIVQEGRIQSLEDRLRTLVLNPSQPDFWTVRIEPTEQPTVTPRTIDVDAAVANALANRTDLARARKDLESTDLTIAFVKNQKLPALDVITNYNLVGNAGTINQFDNDSPQNPPPIISSTQRSFFSALHDVLANDFRTWSVAVQMSYPIGTSQADAALASQRLQKQQQTTGLRELEMQIAQSVRDAGRQVTISMRRVEATVRAREFAQRRLEGEEKRMTVGLSSTFQLFQAQRDLSTAKNQELQAILDYNRALINFDAVQTVPLNGG